MEQTVRIHDDLLHYIGDSLRWIRCYNPSTHKSHLGLNWYGITIITAAEHAAEISDSWLTLFSHSPKRLKLKGPFVSIVGVPGSGRWEYLRLDRDAVIQTLNSFSACCRRAASSKGTEAVIHLGI